MSVLLIALILLGMSLAGALYAADEGEKDEVEPPSRPIYVPIKPAFVVNYGGVGKLRYLKLEVHLRVADTNTSNEVRHHLPLVRDFLVRHFSRLTEDDVSSQQGKEAVRVSALEGLQVLMEEEVGTNGITDLFFSNFVIQR